MPLVMNIFGTMDRVRAALGRDPEGIGEQLVQAVQRLNPPSLSSLWQNRGVLSQLRHMRLQTSGPESARKYPSSPISRSFPS
jgi:3-polyprenyl-4-hydroxybenzoate decarboxylase